MIAGDGITVTGTGSTGDPYVVSGGDAADVALQVTDTTTIDHTLTGDGSAGNPWILSSAVRISGTAGNLITTDAGGLLLTCESVQDCIGGALDDGLVYDDVNNQIRVALSTDPGNSVTFGTDGGVYSTGGGGGGLAFVSTTDNQCIDFSGNGTPGTPLTAAPIVDPADGNILSCTAGGLRAALLLGTCGLEGNADTTPLQVNTGTWPYPCDVDAEGGGVYCDSTGQLRSEPRAKYQYFTISENETVAATAVPATTTTGGTDVRTRSLEITNPDTCRPAIAITEVEVDVDFVLPPGGRAGHFVYGDEMYRFENEGNNTVSDVHTQTTKVLGNTTLLPGQTINVDLIIGLGFGQGGATYNRIQSFIRAMVFAL